MSPTALRRGRSAYRRLNLPQMGRQVLGASAARKHAQALALSNAHIAPYWQQKTFSGSVKTENASPVPLADARHAPTVEFGRVEQAIALDHLGRDPVKLSITDIAPVA